MRHRCRWFDRLGTLSPDLVEPQGLDFARSSEPSLYAVDRASPAVARFGLSAATAWQRRRSGSDSKAFCRSWCADRVPCVCLQARSLVEANPLAGIADNVGSTRVICQTALAAGVREVVLISTDKAVRPTSDGKQASG